MPSEQYRNYSLCILTAIFHKALLKRLDKCLRSEQGGVLAATRLSHWVKESWKALPADMAPSTVNKSSRPLLEPWMCRIPSSFSFCCCFFTRWGPAKPEEGLKIDESSQNRFIAPETCACVMSGKIVLLFCLIEVHKGDCWIEAFDNQG